jgi:hypothetical protein
LFFFVLLRPASSYFSILNQSTNKKRTFCLLAVFPASSEKILCKKLSLFDMTIGGHARPCFFHALTHVANDTIVHALSASNHNSTWTTGSHAPD